MLDRVTSIKILLVLRWTGLVLASTAFAADDLEKARLWRLYVEKKTSQMENNLWVNN